MKTLIKNGRVVTAVDDYVADIFTRGETVTMFDWVDRVIVALDGGLPLC